jgi:TetR/AcrR family transcriptional regulator, transcriptional repressor for nem operon
MKHFSELSASAQRVVDAAEVLIQHAGYNGFSYDDVARQVGIKKPSIHHHFPTKADLVAVVAQRYTHRFREQLLRIEGQHAKATDRLLAYAALFQNTYEQDRRLCVCGMLGAQAEALPPDVATEVQQFFTVNLDWLAQAFAAGQASGLLRASAEPSTQAEVYLCALEGAMVVGRGAARGQGPAAMGRTIVSSLLA